MLNLFAKLQRNRVWSLGLHVAGSDFSFLERVGEPRFVLNSRKPRLRSGHVHTYADPFLFVENEELFVLYERQSVGEHGIIEAVKTRDLENFEFVGEVLREPFHLSYPCVFRSGGSIYLVPESLTSGEINLYRFADFPQNPVKQRSLVKGSYQDPSLTFHDGHWYLFATKGNDLELFVSHDLESGEFVEHPYSPVSADLAISQCGGGVIEMDGTLFRVAQDRSAEYGRNIHILKIRELSPTEYSEELIVADYLTCDQSWNARGGHHLSLVEFLGKTVIATDGKQDDLRINKPLALAGRISAKASTLIAQGREIVRGGNLPSKTKPQSEVVR